MFIELHFFEKKKLLSSKFTFELRSQGVNTLFLHDQYFGTGGERIRTEKIFWKFFPNSKKISPTEIFAWNSQSIEISTSEICFCKNFCIWCKYKLNVVGSPHHLEIWVWINKRRLWKNEKKRINCAIPGWRQHYNRHLWGLKCTSRCRNCPAAYWITAEQLTNSCKT